MQSLEIRAQKGKEIADVFGTINRLDETTYKVKSQSVETYYEVLQTETGWTCQCPDQQFRRVKCKHIWAVEFSFAIRRLVKKEIVIEPISVSNCPKCSSDKLVKHGIRHNKFGDIQRFSCKACGNRFTINLGFERMKHNPKAITSAMQLYFGGESLRHTRDSLKLLGTQVSYQTIHNWISKYVSLMKTYLDKIQPQVGNAWRTDEVYVKVRGNIKYLFALMDDETRFWIAQQVSENKGTSNVRPMFQQGKEIAGKKPEVLISDAAQNFHDAWRKEFYTKRLPRTRHIQEITLTGKNGSVHNEKMERMNGEIRDREKVVRGVKSIESPLFGGLQIYHNYLKPHLALDEKTPAEAAGITVKGEDKLLTLIQNASHVPSFDSGFHKLENGSCP